MTIGYVQLYFKVTGRYNIYYYLLDCEFGSPSQDSIVTSVNVGNVDCGDW